MAIGLSISVTALAGSDDKAKFAEMATNLAPMIGAADYCGGNGQALVDAFARGLEHFDLGPADIQAVLVAMEERRRQARAESAAALADRPCPAETREKVRNALQEMENAWYRVVQNEVGVDLRRAVPVPVAAGAEPSAAALCVKGRAVSVLYGGEWYPAKVLDGPDRMGTCLVSYDGYGSNWDEWVNARRMRPAANGQAAAAPAQPAADTVPNAVPVGKYSCYTYDNGQLNYTYTDVDIQANGRYTVGNKGGRYTLSEGGALRFTGTMANATGKFSVKNGGKPQIDLVFNGDARASMSCPKAG